MSKNIESTLPKPFVFVLMPFDKTLKDLYELGIKGACDDVGAYAERLDEQIFVEGMLDRIFNQISKADVIVADVTKRNPNVFYEVGYAHALGKIVLLVTKDAEDIPFDLKQKQHIVHEGSIVNLRKDLVQKLKWAIAKAHSNPTGKPGEKISIRIFDKEIPISSESKKFPRIEGKVSREYFQLPLHIRNDSYEEIPAITHVYLYTNNKAKIIPFEYTTEYRPGITYGPLSTIPSSESFQVPKLLEHFRPNLIDVPDRMTKQFRLPISFKGLPPGAVEVSDLKLIFIDNATKSNTLYRIRFHTTTQFHDFSFRINISLISDD